MGNIPPACQAAIQTQPRSSFAGTIALKSLVLSYYPLTFELHTIKALGTRNSQSLRSRPYTSSNGPAMPEIKDSGTGSADAWEAKAETPAAQPKPLSCHIAPCKRKVSKHKRCRTAGVGPQLQDQIGRHTCDPTSTNRLEHGVVFAHTQSVCRTAQSTTYIHSSTYKSFLRRRCSKLMTCFSLYFGASTSKPETGSLPERG